MDDVAGPDAQESNDVNESHDVKDPDKLTDAELAAIADNDEPETIELQVAPHDLVIQAANVNVQKDADGNAMVVIGPILLTIALPVPQHNVSRLATALTGGVAIARTMPSDLRRPT